MGCWDETDAITHAPIHGGEPVVMVLLTQKGTDRSWWTDPWLFVRDCVEGVYKGSYNEYGWISEIPEWEGRPDFRAIFFRESVWDTICKMQPKPEEPRGKVGEIAFIDELTAVTAFACRNRLHLNVGLDYKGCQSYYPEHKKDYEAYLQLLQDEWKQASERYLAEYGEEEDEEQS
jgi:hypothetical protein